MSDVSGNQNIILSKLEIYLKQISQGEPPAYASLDLITVWGERKWKVVQVSLRFSESNRKKKFSKFVWAFLRVEGVQDEVVP